MTGIKSSLIQSAKIMNLRQIVIICALCDDDGQIILLHNSRCGQFTFSLVKNNHNVIGLQFCPDKIIMSAV